MAESILKFKKLQRDPRCQLWLLASHKYLGIFFFFVLSMFCISFLSFRKTYDVSYWSDCFLKQCSWFSQPIKGERPEWPRVSMSQSGWGPTRQRPRDLRYQDIIESRYSSVRDSPNYPQVCFFFLIAKYTQPGLGRFNSNSWFFGMDWRDIFLKSHDELRVESYWSRV